MSRSWSNFGFTPAAEKILNETRRVGVRRIIERYDDGGVISREEVMLAPAYTSEVYSQDDVWYGEILELRTYTFSDGRVLEGYVQATVHSGGPNTFLALRNKKTGIPIIETLWSDAELYSV